MGHVKEEKENVTCWLGPRIRCQVDYLAKWYMSWRLQKGVVPTPQAAASHPHAHRPVQSWKAKRPCAASPLKEVVLHCGIKQRATTSSSIPTLEWGKRKKKNQYQKTWVLVLLPYKLLNVALTHADLTVSSWKWHDGIEYCLSSHMGLKILLFWMYVKEIPFLSEIFREAGIIRATWRSPNDHFQD